MPGDAEKGFIYDFAAAYRTPAGFSQFISLSEGKAAFPAYRRLDDEPVFCLVHGLPYMFEMLIDLLFRNPHIGRYVFCGESITIQQSYYLLPDGLPSFGRNRYIFLFHLPTLQALYAWL